MAGFFKRLKEVVFGATRPAPRAQSPATINPATRLLPPEPSAHPGRFEREPCFVQIGFDFGTAFCKCICRDVILDKAWIHIPPGGGHAELPFLIPSAVCFDGETLRHSESTRGNYENGGLHHLKMALQTIGLSEWSDPVLASYRASVSGNCNMEVLRFVEMCAIYLIGGAIGSVKQDVRRRFPGEVKGDYLAVNMAVPVADANHPGVNAQFDRTLRSAWVLAEELAGHPPISQADLLSLIKAKSGEVEREEVKEACFIYPEVSANVQGFVRSRVSREGIYLFSDTGAGTVDQSVFLFARPGGEDHLTYLHAAVFPLGSSRIERIAASEDDNESLENLERWRLRKEAGENTRHLQTARRMIEEQLGPATTQTISCSKQKLFSRGQINDLRVIFGGGGHCQIPYCSAVIKQFDGSIFRSNEIQQRRLRGDTFGIGMPIPRDLQLNENQRRWMDRLTVAYGLSFETGQLATFKLPRDVDIPPVEQIWRPIRQTIQAPSQEET